MSTLPLLVGCDFSSSPSARKPIVLALGHAQGACVRLDALLRLNSLPEFARWLQQPQAWVGGFDLPFGLPRELVQTLRWPTEWLACMEHFATLSRAEVRAAFKAFCDARPQGAKFAHRATDRPAGSSPSMKWVNPPVAYMMHAGVPLLIEAGVTLPGLYAPVHRGGAAPLERVALEAYPGLLARELIGAVSYKSDDRQRQTTERLLARKDLITALEQGKSRLGLRIRLSNAQRDTLADDASGDSLDAVLCLLQAAWAQARHAAGHRPYGLPADLDALEGWIVSA